MVIFEAQIDLLNYIICKSCLGDSYNISWIDKVGMLPGTRHPGAYSDNLRNRDMNFITKDCARYHAIYNNVYKLADSGRFACGLQISTGLQKNL